MSGRQILITLALALILTKDYYNLIYIYIKGKIERNFKNAFQNNINFI